MKLKPKSKRRWAIGLLATAGVALVAASAGTVTALSDPVPEQSAIHDDWDEIRKRWFVEHHLRGMSLEEKVGQLFVTYAYGETADTTDPDDVADNRADHGVDNAAQLLEQYHLGGVIYFSWSDNVNEPHQIAGLSNGLQETALDDTGTPLLISTDQEHGLVTRIGPPATQLPGAMALGASHDADAALTAAEISGDELRAMGINQNFAPVADVNVNPGNPIIGVRSFSSDPQHAADMVAAQVAGYQSDGDLASTIKHFPGHGDTTADSHTHLPQIDHTYQEWTELDAPPFEAAIAEGVDSVMSAHIQFPALDETLTPATLSEPILTGLLREQLGYDGVVVTDSLQMEGVRTGYGDDRVPVLALLAGADMLLMPPDIDLAYNAVLDAVETGEIPKRRLNESVTRVLELKYDLGLFDDPYAYVDAIDGVVGTDEHLETAQAISDRTTTLVVNDGALPAAATGDALVTGWGVTTTATVAGEMSERGWNADNVVTGIRPAQDDIDAAVAAAEGKDLVVVTTNGVATAPGQAALVAALHETGVPVVAVGVRNPYDIARYPDDVNAYLATYSYGAGGLESAVKAILGETEPQGRLPVDIPSADDPATALFPFGHGLSY
ncbi:glycoside hydrolase family 3 protein [Glycomyces sp. L485]|uniref:glycoside hydrolase family 3 protein n=1 Tax=Glycomyces sp. L485 TaxID=2909235 RepID=UPI001F4A2CAE|nr:glycoside hydrolase family 3 protein [Glycomyces sp. L485]MCH7232696.1 glycoside hydrolase family 3 protein [Glycomyces sp. L485]